MINLKKIGLLLLISGVITGMAQAADKPSNPSGAIFATSAADGGRVLITRSPVLGYKSRVDITIDGKHAGIVARQRPFDRYLTPGRHILTATPSRGSAWRAVLDVRVGETYSYTASYNVNKLVLTAMPGAR